MKLTRLSSAAALALFAGSALAHPGHDTTSLFAGFGHPLGGLDHLLAMLAVGLYAARQPGVQRWALPVGFVLAMLAGAGLSAAGMVLPAVEAGIGASVLVLGLLIAFMVRLPAAAALPLVAAFALFHGHAHHAEIGDGAVLAFSAGFVAATALLHAAGYALARSLPQSGPGRVAGRIAGVAIAAAGAVFLGSA